MDCARYESDLGAYIDSGAASTAALDEHLASCARCRALAADLRAIRTTARTLEAPPPPEVWSRLAAAINDSPRRGPLPRLWSYMTARPLAAAAVVVIALLVWVGTRTVPNPASSGEQTGTLSPAARIVEAQYTDEISRLEAIANLEEVAALDPETADVLKENLTVIDQAIGETRAALDEEPDNELVLESLFAALQSRLGLLQDMIVLLNEMRKGNQEEAARIASEVDP